MNIDLSELFNNNIRYKRCADSQGTVSKSYTAVIDSDTFDSGLGIYDIVDKKPVELTVTVNGRNIAHIEGRGNITLVIPCDRCLDPVKCDIEYDIDRDLDFNTDSDKEDMSFADGYLIDVDEFIHPDIAMALPMKILCRPDCKGICRKCGINLNRDTCDCDTFVPDPRMSVITDIFKNFSK